MGASAKNKQAALNDQMFAATEAQLAKYNEEQVIQRELLEKQKEKYRGFQFKNPYGAMQNQFAGMQNQFTGMQNQYAGMENVFEDATVNMQAAQFQAQQGQQQRSNIMSGLRGAAGGSGIAGLAQAMANQGQLQAQQISAGIGQQESQNKMMAGQAAMQLQQMERQGASAVDIMQRRGASAVDIAVRQGAGQADMAQRGGAAMVQSAEMQRQSTLLGIEYGGMAGANAGVQAAYGNQMAAFGASANMIGSQMAMTGAMYGAAGSAIGGMSDRRLKKNINKIGESSSGLNIYSFEFKNSKYGEGLFQGVMSDEIPQEAVGTRDGYDIVDYSMLDVEFKQI